MRYMCAYVLMHAHTHVPLPVLIISKIKFIVSSSICIYMRAYVLMHAHAHVHYLCWSLVRSNV